MSETGFSVRELWIGEQGNRIYGKLYLPENANRPPLAVYAHEIACTHSRAKPYAELLAAKGMALFAPDFRGGGDHCRSDGNTVDMSVETEVQDLERVLDAAAGWTCVDAARCVLIGASQGGLVAAIYAARHPERVSALVELYPAFVVPEAIKEVFPSIDVVPEKFYFDNWLWMGRKYYEDMWRYDAYGEPMNYKGPVLIMQGDCDEIVPLRCAVKAAGLYADARLHVFRGAGHMFSGGYMDRALKLIDEFLTGLGLLEG